jgi:hypothetical protein
MGEREIKSGSNVMDHEGSLLHSQEPATCPCPEPDDPSPFPPHALTIHFNTIPAIFPSKPWSSKSSPSFRLRHQNPVCTSVLPHPLKCVLGQTENVNIEMKRSYKRL